MKTTASQNVTEKRKISHLSEIPKHDFSVIQIYLFLRERKIQYGLERGLKRNFIILNP